MTTTGRIGFIGLGSLGTPIAENILDSGHKLHVYNRTISKTALLSAKGATVCKSVAELAQESTVVFTLVSDDAALKSICEQDGLLDHLPPGSLHISMSTILPATASYLAELHAKKNHYYVAAPVFGRPQAAASRKLNFVLSGDEEAKSSITPLLKDAGAAGIWDFGTDIEAANTVKLCGNFVIASAIEAIGESIQLAKKSGLNPSAVWSMFTQTIFNSPVYVSYSEGILQQRFEPAGFTMKLGLKDVNLVLEQAAAVDQVMPIAKVLQSNMEQLIKEGKEHLDWSAMAMPANGK
jgi:3-hydroxyisobutyrate dehydrogenase-like beta-hydroxyacid dehydrogenase